ncbi:MAG: beta-N-acetylhexosaminidase [Bryobacterales bacterium]|nr:beta-N-acetylhexosaminidase [Bryobacterales bacterium]
MAVALPLGAQPPTELWLRGYSVIPTPQRVQLGAGDVIVDATWRLDPGAVSPEHIAVRSLAADLREFHGLELPRGIAERRVIRLGIAPGTVRTGLEPGIDRQAYRMRITPEVVEITGNADPGLFYGVQTLVQLLKRDGAGRLRLPVATIEDWPRLELRFLHWDSTHHQDRIETLKRYLDWAARFKANMISFELSDKFEYPTHPVMGAPGAFTTAELQEIVHYGLERFIQVVPQIPAPARMAYVLKHPEFAELRADGNNYQANWCDPRTFDLIFSMYDDAIRATPGVEYLFVSTEEVYYAGIDPRCGTPYNDENRSLAWVEFVRRAHEHLTKRGRKMLFWAEYPLLPQHVKLLPPDLIDGVIGEEEYLEWENQLGMRQLGYVVLQEDERLFPDYLGLERAGRMALGRLESAFEYLARGRHWRGRPIGVFGAARDDSGLHNETFWLGWSAVAQWGWHPGKASAAQHAAEFMRIYYGPNTEGMVEVYRSMQAQARAWERTWDRVASRTRGPGYGSAEGKGLGTTRYDLTLAAPGLPRLPDLRFEPVVRRRYQAFIEEARRRMLDNDRLVHALQTNLGKAERNHYNLEVFLSLARFIGHKWRLLDRMAQAEEALEQARQSALRTHPAQAVAHLVTAYRLVERARRQGERIFAELIAVYEKSRFPKGQTVGGRKFVHVFDDTKDHWADRTPDLSFMMAPERSIGLDQWLEDLAHVTRRYAQMHNVPVKGLAEIPPGE